MRFYEFHFRDGRGQAPSLDFTECPDDETAVRAAFVALQGHASCEGVEVFDGERRVAWVERPPQTWPSRPRG